MPPLITREEAVRLGELEDHAAIEALVQRAWEARVERFGDSTDMCSLVNAKSGGCAEDCGFCAQSKYADAETPMHAMMEPEQILEHARAAESAGAHRFCMVTQGQGLSQARLREGAGRARGWSPSTPTSSAAHRSVTCLSRARERSKEAGIQRVHHNVENAESYYAEVSTTVRYEGRLRTIEAVREAGLETCVGGILNLGETREQRVEMAFELAAINPTSVPINLLNPRPGTKFGDRELMDPWEVVKWIAIFRLILPEALFRLCGGRVENLGELQATAVKAGLNGVMMGNFLTTLGNTPERGPGDVRGPRAERRAASPTTAPTRGPTTARAGSRARRPTSSRRRWLSYRSVLWDPSTQLRYAPKRAVPPRPDGAPNRGREREAA